MTHYKVLVNGHSAHGGTLQWSLPRDGEPGDWHEVEGPIRVCRNGLHLTTDPMQWPTVGMVVYEAEGEGDADTGGSDKTAYRRARLIREAPETIPDYWRAVERFVTEEIPAVPWFQPDGDPDPAWRLFTAPRWNAAGNAARSAAWSAGLYTRVTHICADLPLDQRHRDHARARWKVWQKGYALLCDVDGVLYVYAQEGA